MSAKVEVTDDELNALAGELLALSAASIAGWHPSFSNRIAAAAQRLRELARSTPAIGNVDVSTTTATSEGRITLITLDRLAEIIRGVQKKIGAETQGENEDSYDVVASCLGHLVSALYREAGK